VNSTRVDIDALVNRLSASMTLLTRSAAIRRLHQRVASAAGADIERSSYLVLKHLVQEGPARITELALHFGVEPSTLSRHVSALARGRLVKKAADPDDRRAALATATAEGVALVEAVERERRKLFASILSEWDPEDAERLVELIERFHHEITDLLDRE
jgi:DNA-binding MarR family transcriptional regulator